MTLQVKKFINDIMIEDYSWWKQTPVFFVYENFDHSWQPYLDKRTTKNDSIFNYFTFFDNCGNPI